MELFYYPKKQNHKSADTDVLILTSVGAFCEKNSLSAYSGKVLRTPLGKPYLENNYLFTGVTHTSDVIIVGVCEKSFGIDCESKSRVIKNPERIINRFFTDNEKRFILSSKDKQQAFLEIWVKKEAYLKYTGDGISDLCNCDVTEIYGFTKIQNDKNLIIYIYEDNSNG